MDSPTQLSVIDQIGKAIEMSFAHPDAENATNALFDIGDGLRDIAQALRSIARAVRTEVESAK